MQKCIFSEPWPFLWSAQLSGAWFNCAPHLQSTPPSVLCYRIRAALLELLLLLVTVAFSCSLKAPSIRCWWLVPRSRAAVCVIWGSTESVGGTHLLASSRSFWELRKRKGCWRLESNLIAESKELRGFCVFYFQRKVYLSHKGMFLLL